MSDLHLMRQWRDIDDFLPDLRARTTSTETAARLPDDVLRINLRAAIIDFCERTKVIRQSLRIPLICGVCDYPIILDTCEDIVGVGRVRYGDTCETDCKGVTRQWDWGGIVFRLMEDSDVLRISEPPVEDGKFLEMDVFTAPSRDGNQVDAILFQRYYTPIVDLTLSKIHLMTDAHWASVTRADMYRRNFESSVASINEQRMDVGTENKYLVGIRPRGYSDRRL